MTTEFELRDRIRTVLMNSLNQHHYSKMEDELAAVIKEIVAEQREAVVQECADVCFNEDYMSGSDYGREILNRFRS